MAVTIKLLDTAAQLAIELAPQFPRASFDERVNLVREMSEFCNKFPRVEGWLDVVVTAAKLGRTSLTGLRKIHLRTEFGYGRNPNPLLPRFDVRKMEWIYMALEHVQTAWQEGLGDSDAEDEEWDNNTLRSINGLLQVLSCNDSLPDNPPVPSLKVILRALCSPTGVAATALLVLSRAKSWFLNPDLQPIMLQFSMWHHLGRVARCYKEEDRSGEDVITDSYQHILQHVAPRPEWKSALFEELPTCITIFSDPSGSRWFDEEPQKLDFISVLRNIWVPQFPHIEGQQQQIEVTDAGQQCTALCLVALSNVWERHDMAKSSLEQFLQLARCTVSTALPWNQILSPLRNFLPFFSSRLCRALAQAAANTRHSIRVGIPGGLDAGSSRVEAHLARRMVELLEMLTQRLEIEFNNPDRLGTEVLRRRDTLRDEIAAEIKAWEESLGHGEEGVPAEASAAQVGQQEGGKEEEGGRIAIAVG
ncbi:hypothetical protein C8F04DRAFT_1275789 [Mycena alexandri]|uniref:Uncharacterized protein n=1 Tax=Mycena alexandri TaxID=1745969 RepID=A0AAD6WT15_9AGAR|nr:hypothetical protein C8F04DRAFT_1275789 [Mycena alexandri]